MKETLNLNPFVDLVTDQIAPTQLADVIDEVMFEYACLNLSIPKEICPSAVDKLGWLKKLRDVLKALRE